MSRLAIFSLLGFCSVLIAAPVEAAPPDRPECHVQTARLQRDARRPPIASPRVRTAPRPGFNVRAHAAPPPRPVFNARSHYGPPPRPGFANRVYAPPPRAWGGLRPGEVLPYSYRHRPPPPSVLRRLPHRHGYEWLAVGRDLVLIAAGTAVIVDILRNDAY